MQWGLNKIGLERAWFQSPLVLSFLSDSWRASRPHLGPLLHSFSSSCSYSSPHIVSSLTMRGGSTGKTPLCHSSGTHMILVSNHKPVEQVWKFWCLPSSHLPKHQKDYFFVFHFLMRKSWNRCFFKESRWPPPCNRISRFMHRTNKLTIRVFWKFIWWF